MRGIVRTALSGVVRLELQYSDPTAKVNRGNGGKKTAKPEPQKREDRRA